jgi:hypothetical protein
VATWPSLVDCDGRAALLPLTMTELAGGDRQIMMTTTTLLYVEGIMILFDLL